MKANKNRLPFIDKLALWFNYLLCFALILSYLAPIVDPRKSWIIAFFGLAYPPLLVANILIMIYWLLRHTRYLLLSLVTILIGWNALNNNIGFRFKTDPKHAGSSNTIRLMTYNVHNFKRYGERNDSSTRHDILKIIKDQGPDILGIQEFYTRKRGKYAILDSVKKILNSSHYYFEPIIYNADEAMGIAIFSKYPIANRGKVKLSQDGGNQCLFTDINKNNQLVRIYSVHLQSIMFDPEDYQYLDSISKKGKTNLLSVRRIGGKLKRAFLKRSEQVKIIKQHASTCPYPYIIAGDFNDTPSSYAVNQMAKGLQNAFREKGAGLGRTYNGDFPNYQIDYIMATKTFEVASYYIIEKKLSDHYAVCSDLLLK